MKISFLQAYSGLWLGLMSFILFILTSEVHADATTIKACFKGGSFANCEKFNSTSSHCATMTGSSYNSCYCNQGYFNAIVGCLNDDLKCYQNAANFAPTATSLMSSFNSVCSAVATITTPSIYSISRTIYPDACAMVHSDCMDELAFLNSCSSTYLASLSIPYGPWGIRPKSGFDKTYCLCQPREIQLASRCTFNANISCFGKDAHMTNMAVYKSCEVSDVTPWFAAAEPTKSGEGRSEAGPVATERMVVTRYETAAETGAAMVTAIAGFSSAAPLGINRLAAVFAVVALISY